MLHRPGFLLLLLVLSFPAAAVRLGNGAGQVLIYPYYTVRASDVSSPHNALLSIVNRSPNGKVVRLRFREALAGAPVLEATVFLSPRDVWTAAIVPAGDGAGLLTVDRSCTRPPVTPGTGGAPSSLGLFANDAYASDPLGAAMERTREGFVEVIEMGTVRRDSALYRAIVHVAGAPPCNLGSDTAIAADLDPPSGDLYGSMTLVEVMGGTAYGYDAVALEDFSRTVLYPASSSLPTLAAANPPTSSVIAAGRAFISNWASGVDAVNAVLSSEYVEAEFMREASVAGATDIAYAFPTKPLLVGMQQAIAPFSQTLTANGACEPANDTTYDREERAWSPAQESGFDFSPYATLCYAVTVQSLATVWPLPSGVVGSSTGLRHALGDIPLFPAPTIWPNGVASLRFATGSLKAPGITSIVDLATGTRTQAQDVVYFGMPVVGVSFVRYVNGALVVGGQRTLSNYGAGGQVRTLPGVRLP